MNITFSFKIVKLHWLFSIAFAYIN